MPNTSDLDEMTSRELQRNIQLMAESITQLSNNVSTLVESDIRRQERESRQQEFNNQIRDRVHVLENWQKDIEINRAKESQGREVLMKYWWLLMLIGMAATYKLTKTDIITLLG